MIPSRADIYLGTDDPLGQLANEADDALVLPHQQQRRLAFFRVGYITFDNNTSTGFKVRELKSVHLDGMTGEYLKLVFHEAHHNHLNLFNQIALVAINLLGQREGEERANNGAAPMEHFDLEDELCQDPQLLQWIRAATATKNECVDREDFIMAKTMKQLLMILSARKDKWAALVSRKLAAIDADDFDLAESVKQELESERKALFSALETDQFRLSDDGKLVEAGKTTFNSIQVPSNYASNNQLNSSTTRFNTKSGNDSVSNAQAQPPPLPRNFDDMPVGGKKNPFPVDEFPSAEAPPKPKKNIAEPSKTQNMPVVSNPGAAKALEERPIKPSQTSYSMDQFDENSVPPDVNGKSPGRSKASMVAPKQFLKKRTGATSKTSETKKDDETENQEDETPAEKKEGDKSEETPKKSRFARPKPAGKKQDEDPNKHPFDPHPVAPFDLKDQPAIPSLLNDVEAQFGEGISQCLAHKEFPKRDWALNYVADGMEKLGMDKVTPDMTRASYDAVLFAIEDSREKIVISTTRLWNVLLNLGATPTVAGAATSLIANLCSKPDSNQRTTKACLDLLSQVCFKWSNGVDLLIKAIQPSRAPKILKSRLISLKFVSEDLAKQNATPRFDERACLNALKTLLGHASGDIRDLATKCVSALCMLLSVRLGSETARQMVLGGLTGTKPQLLKTIDKNLIELPSILSAQPESVSETDIDIEPTPKPSKPALAPINQPVKRVQSLVEDTIEPPKVVSNSVDSSVRVSQPPSKRASQQSAQTQLQPQVARIVEDDIMVVKKVQSQKVLHPVVIPTPPEIEVETAPADPQEAIGAPTEQAEVPWALNKYA